MEGPGTEQEERCDYKGNVITEIADGKDLSDLAKRLNVPEDFWPVGFNLSLAGKSAVSPERSKVDVSVFAVEASDYFDDIEEISIEGINKKIKSKSFSLRVSEFSAKMPVSELFAFFKTLNITCFNANLQTQRMEVIKR